MGLHLRIQGLPSMKAFFHKQEKSAHINLSELLHSVMSPESSYGSFEDVKLEGKNFGATMIARRGCAGELSHDCCSINIYVSNNIQGVNNSILVGSEVKMGDPCASLSLKDVKLDGGFQKSSMKKMNESVNLGFCLMFLFAVVLALLLSTF